MMELEDLDDLRRSDDFRRRRTARLLQAPCPQDPDHFPDEEDEEEFA